MSKFTVKKIENGVSFETLDGQVLGTITINGIVGISRENMAINTYGFTGLASDCIDAMNAQAPEYWCSLTRYPAQESYNDVYSFKIPGHTEVEYALSFLSGFRFGNTSKEDLAKIKRAVKKGFVFELN